MLHNSLPTYETVSNDDFQVNEPAPQYSPSIPRDQRYYSLLTDALRRCLTYKPKFGQGRSAGLSLSEFRVLYSQDPLYHWLGLDSPLMYAAHKAAGGMTSIYRQIGIGLQWVFQACLCDGLGLSQEQAIWSYQVPGSGGRQRTLTLDGRIETENVRNRAKRSAVSNWVSGVIASINLPDSTRERIRGVVFEVRQGYKSKDSKRQNADIANASHAYANSYVPVLLLFSTQIDDDVALRYRQNLWVLLSGNIQGSAGQSSFAFFREVLGFDLANFLETRKHDLRREVEGVLSALLSA